MFCKNCGKEIEENVKFCSHCGYNFQIETTTEKIISSKIESKLRSGFVLNIISLIIALTILIGLPYITELIYYDADKDNLVFTLPQISMSAVILTSLVGFYIKSALNKSNSNRSIVYIYLIATLASTILTIISSVFIFPLMFCFVGLIYYVPVLLQIIATTKFFQATK